MRGFSDVRTYARVLGLAVVAWAGSAGCVERTLKIQTDPPGALVTLNDEEVGLTPVKTSFLWYGDYDVIIRKQGYKTVRTSYRLSPPWYQWPVIDFFTETLVPVTFRDEQETPVFVLAPAEPPLIADVIDRAEDARHRATTFAP